MSSVQKLAGLKKWNKPAGSQHLEEKFGRRRTFQGFAGSEIRHDPVRDVDTKAVPRLDELMDSGNLENRKTYLMPVPVEGPRETLREHSRCTCGFDGFRRDCTSGGTTEIPAGHNHIARLNFLWELRIQ